MSDAWINVGELKQRLGTFFGSKYHEFSRFGSTVNQTFEAFVLAQVVSWYRDQPGWVVTLRNPVDRNTGAEVFRLKFSTRGRPGGYSYFECRDPDGAVVHVRHQLRVATKWHRQDQQPAANVCLDVAVVRELDVTQMSTSDFVPNESLITFGEAKHMSAFAELVASFIGLVHELQPRRLSRVRKARQPAGVHPSPFLFVSGRLWSTADGVIHTIRHRRCDIDVYWNTNQMTRGVVLPTDKPSNHALKPTALASQ